jgi:Ca2+-binding EF-hand superfamily protein
LDERSHFRKLFKRADRDKDGKIDFDELHNALRKELRLERFDELTVGLLIDKFEKNDDNKLTFSEFYKCFINVNEELSIFMKIDQNSNGFIDAKELSKGMRRNGYDFSNEFYDQIYDDICVEYNIRKGITFDLFIRISARFQYLEEKFDKMDRYKRKKYYDDSLEEFILRKFFN